MSLANQISNIIAVPVGKLASWIEQTYNIQSTDVIEQWNVISGMDMNEKKPRARSQRTKKQCEYIFSGARAGEQCDVTPKSGVYCSKHTPKDKTVTKAKSSAKKATTEISKDFGSDDDIAPVVVTPKPKTVKKPKAKKEESDDDVVVTPKPTTVKKPKAKKEESDDDVVVTPKPTTVKKPKAKKEEEASIEQHPTTEPKVVTEDEDEEPNIPTKPLLKSRKVLSVDKLDNGINVSSDED